ncbi:hypothetical protein BH23ACT5_BH23ACT5_22190 [soil metagenome]
MVRRFYRHLTVGRVILMLPLVAIITQARQMVRDNSFLWHIRAGELQIADNSVLTADPFSFIALGEPWRTQSWLADLLYGFFEGLSPLTVGSWVTAFSALLLVGCVGIRAYRALPSTLVAGVVSLWVMWLSLGWFSPRPVVISLGMFSLLLLVGDYPRLRWTIPLLMWIWASIHGGFVVGLGYLALDGLRRRDRTRIADVAVSAAFASVTAHGWGVWEVLLAFVRSNEALDSIIEWATPDLFSIALIPFLGVLVALIVAARAGRMSSGDLWVVVPFLLFAFTAGRSVPLAALALVPWMTLSLERLTRFAPSRSEGSPITALVAAVVLLVPFLVPLDGGLDPARFPLEAAEHLTAERVFHDDAIGGYLIYSQFPDRLVYIDDRAELFEERYVAFGKARGGLPVWQEVFDEHGFEEVLLRKEAPLIQVLTAGGWLERFSDETFIVLEQPPS